MEFSLPHSIQIFNQKFKGIIFHCDCISHHSIGPFIELSKYTDVHVSTPKLEFRNLGKIDVGQITIHQVKAFSDVDAVIHRYTDYLHVTWGGLKVWSSEDLTCYALKRLCIIKKPVIVLYQEQYPWKEGLKGFIRRVKWYFDMHFSYKRNVTLIGCTGQSSINAYIKAGINRKKLFDYIYTPIDSRIREINTHHETVHFSYIGQLIPRKCIIELINEFLSIPKKTFHLNIIGNGPLQKEILNMIGNCPNIYYSNYLSREDIGKLLCNTDVLLLPSLFDGWGATVNEGLMKGCRIIVSDGCGSHSLILSNNQLGQCFKAGNWSDFHNCISNELKRGPQSKIEKKQISDWAVRIQSEMSADYLIKIINHYLFGLGNIPLAPWSV